MGGRNFEICIARPDADGANFLLSDHLRAVGAKASQYEEGMRRELLNLAGVLHDTGKARESWQHYIRGEGSGVNHAFLGSALFFYLVQQHNLPRDMVRYAMFLCRDIACHHGRLDDLEADPPWIGGWQSGALSEMDVEGFRRFLHSECPSFSSLPEEGTRLEQELRQMNRRWRKWFMMQLDSIDDLPTAVGWALRLPTSYLIAADRFDAANIDQDEGINAKTAEVSLGRIEEYVNTEKNRVNSLGGAVMAEFRERVQKAVEGRVQAEDKPITILQMPTGSGKTIVALKAALNHFHNRPGGRLIYVAPYLSIVTQVADVIRTAAALEVLEQHHMALPPVKGAERVEGPLLLMESWQSPAVVTTFNQLFTTLFPAKAQESMRLTALRNAYVVIDEPQIMDSSAWNMFLTMLGSVVRELDTQVLIMSATVPPFQFAHLPDMVTVVESPPLPAESGRFHLSVAGEAKNAQSTAQWALECAHSAGSCAVILNTIADVAQVASLLQEESSITLFVLHGAMQPLHKTYQLHLIKKALEDPIRPTLVVATQTLEAGIDISFRQVLRARAILPSIIQAAGRANRHGENDAATVSVFDFYRDDGKDSRPFVYRDAIMREETDAVLFPERVVTELEIPKMLNSYFKRVFERNNYAAGTQRIIDAANGHWARLAGLEPFGQNYIPQEPVFIPLGGPPDCPEQWIGDDTRELMQLFDVEVEQIYERFTSRGFLRRLDFISRKRFLNLIGRFIVNVRPSLIGLTEMNAQLSIQRLVDVESYSMALGLGHWYLRGAQDEGVIL
ncbi:MAG: CRISPR-associated helicase Cas3' [Firmicutes bacterium]|nr:CRISPR-associated helicase Cas3' [Bacillota bacterium]